MAFGFTLQLPTALEQSWSFHRQTLSAHWPSFLAIGIAMALSVAFGNASLVHVSLSLSQIIKALLPLFSCGLTAAVERKYPCRKEATSLAILAGGVVMAVWQGAIAGSPLGIAMCIAATACNSCMSIFSCSVLSRQVGPGSLAFYTAPVAVATLLPFAVTHEARLHSI